MVTVVCVYKPGNGFTSEYVWKLYFSLMEQLVDFTFLCLTTDQDLAEKLNREALLLPDIYPGWWNKMWVFRKGVIETERVVYIDLDTMVLGDITPLLTYDGDLPLFLDDFNHSGNLASGIMAFKEGMFDNVYQDFVKESDKFINTYDRRGGSDRGDQAVLRRYVDNWRPVQEVQPGVYSYKKHIKQGVVKPGTETIVCFHGNPRPHEVRWQI